MNDELKKLLKCLEITKANEFTPAYKLIQGVLDVDTSKACIITSGLRTFLGLRSEKYCKNSLLERIDEIKEAIDNGLTTGQMSKKFKCTTSGLYKLAKKEKLDLNITDRRWTKIQELTLVKMRKEGYKVPVIARKIGKTENAVYNKITTLKILQKDDERYN